VGDYLLPSGTARLVDTEDGVRRYAAERRAAGVPAWVERRQIITTRWEVDDAE
jgi:hypothetical protein